MSATTVGLYGHNCLQLLAKYHCENYSTMTAPDRHICLKFAQINDLFLFATCEKLVVDLEGNVWHPEHYKGSVYFRKKGSQYRIAKSTLRRKSKPCNVLI